MAAQTSRPVRALAEAQLLHERHEANAGSSTTSCTRANVASAISARASASARREGSATARSMHSTAQTNTGYATTSVRRNEESTIHGPATATPAAKSAQPRDCCSSRASAKTGSAARLMTIAFRTCACVSDAATSPCPKIGAIRSG